MRTLGNEKGVSLIMAVATLLILSLTAVVVVSLVGTETFSALNQTQSLQTFDLAEAGAHRAITYLGLEAGTCAAITGAPEFTDVPMGRGTFTVTATHYNPTSTTLTADITDSQTSIPVVSTTDFAPHGRIHILYPPPEVDAVTTATSGNSSMTISHTVSGTDRLLVVGFSQGDEDEPVVSLTYGGTSLTRLGFIRHSGNQARMELWYLIDPPVGTADVAVTLTGPNGDGTVVGVMSFTNVNQTTPFGPFATAEGDGGTPTVDVTSAEGDLVIDVVAFDTPVTTSAGSGQTQYWNIPYSDTHGGGSTEPGADTVTMSWASGGNEWVLGAVSVKSRGREDVNYIDTTATSFTGALRGVNGTTAMSFLSGGLVTQDQCLIRSTGTVDGPSGPAKRVVEVGVEYP